MSFIDPGGIFGTFGTQDESMYETTRTKSHVTHAIFGGTAPINSTSSSSEASTSEQQQYQDHLGSTDSTMALFDEAFGGMVTSTEQYEVSVLGISETGARSRTETQVKLILRIVPRQNLPPIKWLALPPHQLSCARKNKMSEEDCMVDSCPDTLHVRARVVRSDSDEALYSCYSCILRERKRSMRKRAKEDLSDEERQLDTVEKDTEQDRERILIFASQNERLQILRGDVMLPIRLTCYCRHHEERTGFRVKLELLDNCHCLVGSAYSPPILITDDHKRATRQPRPDAFQRPRSPIDFGFREPSVAKVVPSEGPMHGGIEVTVLGENLTAESIIMFGPLPSKVINLISSTTAVVRLPPSHVAGVVSVLVIGQSSLPQRPEDYVLFNYKNDLDRAMMELALQLIGMKMTGRVDDARDIAMRIINEYSPASAQGAGVGNAPVSQQQSSFESNLEGVLITCLAAAEITGGIKFSDADVARFQTCGGQTLLHLAALARYDHLFEYLGGLGEGLLLTTIDKNGFTPADLYYLAGRQDFLETLGLDDSDHEEQLDNLDVLARYRLIQDRACQRTEQPPSSIWGLISAGLARIRRRPSLMRNHMNRLRNSVWRKLTSEESIKEYYLTTFGTTTLALSAGKRIYKSYQESRPYRKRSRDLVFLYFWLPVVLAVLLVWYFDLGANMLNTVTIWEGPGPGQGQGHHIVGPIAT
jgi:hypothetical protein